MTWVARCGMAERGNCAESVMWTVVIWVHALKNVGHSTAIVCRPTLPTDRSRWLRTARHRLGSVRRQTTRTGSMFGYAWKSATKAQTISPPIPPFTAAMKYFLKRLVPASATVRAPPQRQTRHDHLHRGRTTAHYALTAPFHTAARRQPPVPPDPSGDGRQCPQCLPRQAG